MTAYRVLGGLCATDDTGEPIGTGDGGFLIWNWTNGNGEWRMQKADTNGDGLITPDDNYVITSDGRNPLGVPYWEGGFSQVGEYAPRNGAAEIVVVAANPAFATLQINDGPNAGKYVVLRMGQ